MTPQAATLHLDRIRIITDRDYVLCHRSGQAARSAIHRIASPQGVHNLHVLSGHILNVV